MARRDWARWGWGRPGRARQTRLDSAFSRRIIAVIRPATRGPSLFMKHPKMKSPGLSSRGFRVSGHRKRRKRACATVKKIVLPRNATDAERAHASREWQAQRDQELLTRRQRKAGKFAVQVQEAIDSGRVVVQQLPPGPKWQKKRRKAKQHEEIARLRVELHEAHCQIGRLQAILESRNRGGFFESREWQEARYEALRRSNGCCELCGASKKDGVVIQVDHIKPRSKYPDLALEQSNLQVLCRPCNLGKGVGDEIDWRKKPALKVVRGA